ncbi:16S rRNA (guanine(966)-N(2))-methyltransferase RsmD [Oikeobacillus pervagus]|uniref:16S rRNA (Guanine(966)-N(2))-methyltransferase RsmD n=1 Tax=Oikeobacillus pervagus TaxID=1325931 RepID=A0AAJ1SYY5_9BACI|nr:16S rRNA (guanine(966)-N(2))-methyltransferase RsmD [Oikeobacillus pervagus]MDQ0215219.1 16S rRNA (guanine(966)-N(2))-methyltransferase RsmD [Oikeobacillus pervagus]
MRVISGKLKGIQLKAVPGKDTRPTTDKVKEAIFNIVGPYFLEGIGLDLFAGSGGLGIEALSRGFHQMIFVDRDMKAVQTIKTNLSQCHVREESEIYRNHAERALNAVKKRQIQFDGIFLDPPYKKQKLHKLLQIIDEEQLLRKDGFVVCEHSSDIEMPYEVGNLHIVKQESYGIIGISIYEQKAPKN